MLLLAAHPRCSRKSTETLAPFLTIIGVDTTFLAVRAAIRQIVSCFSYYLAGFLTIHLECSEKIIWNYLGFLNAVFWSGNISSLKVKNTFLCWLVFEPAYCFPSL